MMIRNPLQSRAALLGLAFLGLAVIVISLAIARRTNSLQHWAAKQLSRPGIRLFPNVAPDDKQPIASWLIFGDNRYNECDLFLEGVRLTEPEIAALRPFPRFVQVVLIECPSTRQVLEEVERLKVPVYHLGIHGTKLETQDIVRLSRIKNLSSLTIEAVPIVDADFSSLSQAPDLETLCLYRVGLDRNVLKAIAEFSKVDTLAFEKTDLHEDDLAALVAFKELKTLRVQDASITGKGLESFANAGSLETLNFRRCPIDRDGLAVIAKISSLRSVFLFMTPLSRDDIMWFMDLRPDLKVLHD